MNLFFFRTILQQLFTQSASNHCDGKGVMLRVVEAAHIGTFLRIGLLQAVTIVEELHFFHSIHRVVLVDQESDILRHARDTSRSRMLQVLGSWVSTDPCLQLPRFTRRCVRVFVKLVLHDLHCNHFRVTFDKHLSLVLHS